MMAIQSSLVNATGKVVCKDELDALINIGYQVANG
jgi:hypothetical protein